MMPGDKPQLPLPDALSQLRGLMAEEPDLVANAANFTALLVQQLVDINWLGFYFLADGELLLGPFQGAPACVRIAVGRGVCGTAVATGQTQVVADVQAFPGHIACDISSRSELVVPLWHGSEMAGVLDIDSPLVDRFTAGDVQYVEALAAEFCRLQFS